MKKDSCTVFLRPHHPSLKQVRCILLSNFVVVVVVVVVGVLLFVFCHCCVPYVLLPPFGVDNCRSIALTLSNVCLSVHVDCATCR